MRGITISPNTIRTPAALAALLEERKEGNTLSTTTGSTENRYRNSSSFNIINNTSNISNNNNNNTVSNRGSLKDVRAQNGQTPYTGLNRDVLALEAEVHCLKTENEKLRVIEEQFWALLHENELLRKTRVTEDETPTTITTTTSSSIATTRKTIKHEIKEGEDNEKKEEDVWRRSSCVRALRECMDLLLARELSDISPYGTDGVRQQQLQREDSVASYLLWLRTKQRRYNRHTQHNNIDKHTSMQPNGDEEDILPPLSSSSPQQQKQQQQHGQDEMEKKLAIMERELCETREMLELTNASRVAALEDTARMSAQVSTLTAHLQQLLHTPISNPYHIEMMKREKDELLLTIEKQSRDIMLRDQLLADMRVTLQQMRAAKSAAEVSLAEEVKRARQDLLLRRGSTSFDSVAGKSATC